MSNAFMPLAASAWVTSLINVKWKLVSIQAAAAAALTALLINDFILTILLIDNVSYSAAPAHTALTLFYHTAQIKSIIFMHIVYIICVE